MRSDYIDVKPEKIESRTSSRTSSQYSRDRLDSKSEKNDSRSRSTKSSSSSTIRKRKSSDRRSRDRSRSSSKRHRTSKSDISNDKTYHSKIQSLVGLFHSRYLQYYRGAGDRDRFLLQLLCASLCQNISENLKVVKGALVS